MMGCAASLDADHAGRQGLKEFENFGATQLLANNDFSGRINRASLEYVLGEIDANRHSRHRGWLPKVDLTTIHFGTSDAAADAIHPSSYAGMRDAFPKVPLPRMRKTSSLRE